MCDYCTEYDDGFGRDFVDEKIDCGFFGAVLLSAHIFPEQKELRIHLCKTVGDEELLVKVPINACPFCDAPIKLNTT